MWPSWLPRRGGRQHRHVIVIHFHVHRHAPNLGVVGIVRHAAPLMIHHLRHGHLEPLLVEERLAIRQFNDVLVLPNDPHQFLKGGALAHEP